MGLSGKICGCSRLLAPGLTLGFVLSLSDSLSEICELLSFGRKKQNIQITHFAYDFVSFHAGENDSK